MSSVKLSTGGQCLRFVFIAWNVVVLCIGVGAIAVGSWQYVENNTYEFLTGQEYASGAILSIIAGGVAFLVALIGVVGGIALWRVALAVYAIIVALFVVLELASGIVGFVYRNEVEDRVSDRATDAIQKDYRNSSDARDFINEIQNDFDCCGWDNYTDWYESEYYEYEGFPSSCECGNSTSSDCELIRGQNIYNSACRESVIDAIETYELVIGAVGIVFGIIQLTAVVIALALCCLVHRSSGEYTTV